MNIIEDSTICINISTNRGMKVVRKIINIKPAEIIEDQVQIIIPLINSIFPHQYKHIESDY